MLRSKLVIAGVLCAVTFSARAETAAEQIQRLNEEVAVLNARLAKADAELKIAKQETDLQKLRGSVGGFGDEAPVVKGIEGIDGKLYATLLMRNGNAVQTVKAGQTYANWKVKNITQNSVELVRDGKTMFLSFGAEVSGSPQQGMPSVPAPFVR